MSDTYLQQGAHTAHTTAATTASLHNMQTRSRTGHDSATSTVEGQTPPEMLEQAGVKIGEVQQTETKARCKLSVENSAFFVSCKESCKDTFYTEATWPE